MTLRELLLRGRIQFKDSGTNVGHDMIGIHCPFCGESSFHCGIHEYNLWYKCFVCDRSGFWPTIARKLLSVYPHVEWFSIGKALVKERYLDAEVKLPKDLEKYTRAFKKTDITPYEYLTEIPYLSELHDKNRPRGLTDKCIKNYNIGVGINYLDGYVTFQQGENLIARRFSSNESRPRYWKSINKDVFIFGETQVRLMEPNWIVITEGVFDTLALPMGFGLSILGSISSYNWISSLIANLPNSVETAILALDKGVPKKTTNRIHLLLNDCNLQVKQWDWNLFEEVKDMDEARIVYGEELLLDYVRSLLIEAGSTFGTKKSLL